EGGAMEGESSPAVSQETCLEAQRHTSPVERSGGRRRCRGVLSLSTEGAQMDQPGAEKLGQISSRQAAAVVGAAVLAFASPARAMHLAEGILPLGWAALFTLLA